MFELLKTTGHARRARLTVNHGTIETPFFMPIATRGAVKSLSSDDLRDLQAQIVLSNTYHLLLRPGRDGMKQLGGLHAFMNWQGPILTDSGGYQVFSLAKMNEIADDGVAFQSHIDGRRIKLTPAGSMAMQSAIGSDVVMQFDDVAAGNSTKERYEEAMERSLRWARECKDTYDQRQQLFGIVQGGVYEDLRSRSIQGLLDLNFDGYAIGGLSVGESREATFRTTKFVAAQLPTDKPRYFMGGGMPEEIVLAVSVGVDMFDCVLPTRNARHGTLFVWKGNPTECVSRALTLAQDGAPDEMIANVLYEKMIIGKEAFRYDVTPIDPYLDVAAIKHCTKAYLHHLFRTEELLGLRFATLQNLGFYLRLMHELRAALS